MKFLVIFLILILNSYLSFANESRCRKSINDDQFKCNQKLKSPKKKKYQNKFIYELHHPNFGTYLGIGILTSPLAFITSTTLHEGAHALTALSMGHQVGEFKIYPHKKNGKLKFGNVSLKKPFTQSQLYEVETKGYAFEIEKEFAISHLAPMILNASILSIYSGHAIANKMPQNKWVRFGLFILGTTQVIDLLHHAVRSDEGSDSRALIDYLKLTGRSYEQAYALVKIPQYGFAIFGLVGLGLEANRMFLQSKKEYKERKKSLLLAPSFDQSSSGLVLSGQF